MIDFFSYYVIIMNGFRDKLGLCDVPFLLVDLGDL